MDELWAPDLLDVLNPESALQMSSAHPATPPEDSPCHETSAPINEEESNQVLLQHGESQGGESTLHSESMPHRIRGTAAVVLADATVSDDKCPEAENGSSTVKMHAKDECVSLDCLESGSTPHPELLQDSTGMSDETNCTSQCIDNHTKGSCEGDGFGTDRVSGSSAGQAVVAVMGAHKEIRTGDVTEERVTDDRAETEKLGNEAGEWRREDAIVPPECGVRPQTWSGGLETTLQRTVTESVFEDRESSRASAKHEDETEPTASDPAVEAEVEQFAEEAAVVHGGEKSFVEEREGEGEKSTTREVTNEEVEGAGASEKSRAAGAAGSKVGKKKRRRPMLSKKKKQPKPKQPKPAVEMPVPKARIVPNKQLCRDSGYVCAVCRTVFTVDGPCQEYGECRFCPCCGSGLVRGNMDGFSILAQKPEARLSATIDELGRHALEKLIRLRKRRRRCEGEEAGPAGAGAAAQGSKTRKLEDGAAAAAEGSGSGGKGYSPWRRGERGRVQSRFCDICGHGSCSVRCAFCCASFHKLCLALPDGYDPPERGWMCYACMHEAARKDRLDLLAPPSLPPEAPKPKLPDAPQQCASCGYHEAESLSCYGCFRWFCYGCSCLSAATVPDGAWMCPECAGQDEYDARLSRGIAPLRGKVGAMDQKAQDGFAQLVFDLSCGCYWDEWRANVQPLIARCEAQLARHELPSILPFHSLHYPMHKHTLRQISEAYARDAASKADRSFKCNPVLDSKGTAVNHVWARKHIVRDFAVKNSLEHRRKDARLRIGYISSDFVNHPTADLIQSALLLHDRSKFEIFAYSITKDDDSEYRRRLSSELEHFQTLRSSHADRRCAEIIAEQGIHVLVNLNGHTAGDRNGISAMRPAPVQLVYLAYPGTMGAEYIDYNVVDDNVCPPAHREHYSEKLLRMPHCYQANSFSDLYKEVLDPSKLPSRREHQLPDRPAFVFCNFCRLGRITKELFAMWMRILRQVPGSVIWLYKHPRAAVPRLQAHARAAGIDHNRLIFAPPCSPKIEHLKRVTLADLCLDTLVYNGHTTGSDMLWAGVPIVTMRGDNWPSLVATCLANSVDMPEMVVGSMAEYEKRAVELATNPASLRALREKLGVQRLSAPLFDSERWVRSFEDALERAWSNFASSRGPEDLLARDFGISDTAKHLVHQCAPMQPYNGGRFPEAGIAALIAEQRPREAEPALPCPPPLEAGAFDPCVASPGEREDGVEGQSESPVETAPPDDSHNPTPVQAKSSSATPDSRAARQSAGSPSRGERHVDDWRVDEVAAVAKKTDEEAMSVEAPDAAADAGAVEASAEQRALAWATEQGERERTEETVDAGAPRPAAQADPPKELEMEHACPVLTDNPTTGVAIVEAHASAEGGESKTSAEEAGGAGPATRGRSSGAAAGARRRGAAGKADNSPKPSPPAAAAAAKYTPEQLQAWVADIERDAQQASPSPGSIFRSAAVKGLAPGDVLPEDAEERVVKKAKQSLEILQPEAWATAVSRELQMTAQDRAAIDSGTLAEAPRGAAGAKEAEACCSQAVSMAIETRE